MAKTGAAFAVGGAGLLLLWSSVANKGFLMSARDLLQGVQPTAGPTQPFLSSGSTALSSTDSGSSGAVSAVGGNPESGSVRAQNQALGKQMAAAYGWSTGAEWTALNNVVMHESGWDSGPGSANPTSDARGIAQKITGWSPDYQENNAPQQISWLLSYVKSRYGDPIAAWAHEQEYNWY